MEKDGVTDWTWPTSREGVYRRVDADLVEPIQRVVAVDYDNTLQTPLAFAYRGVRHEVLEVIGAFRESPDDPSVLFLLRATGGIYALYVDILDPVGGERLRRARWVLHFRVEDGAESVEQRQGEVEMLVDLQLKLAADFHGHLCPDLVVGYRATRYAMARLQPELAWAPGCFVVAENRTSALDAVQRLTGCTVGNGRLVVHDHGKHSYTYCNREGIGLRVALRPDCVPEDQAYLALEAKVRAGRATLLETARYQALLDERVAFLLRISDDRAFASARVAARLPPETMTSALFACDICGEPVIASRLVSLGSQRLCGPCAEGESSGRG